MSMPIVLGVAEINGPVRTVGESTNVYRAGTMGVRQHHMVYA
jgi:hypothetical protein